jgi:hypothetical protein
MDEGIEHTKLACSTNFASRLAPLTTNLALAASEVAYDTANNRDSVSTQRGIPDLDQMVGINRVIER